MIPVGVFVLPGLVREMLIGSGYLKMAVSLGILGILGINAMAEEYIVSS